MENISIRLTDDLILKIKDIKKWLSDMPFTDVKEPTTSEVIRICISHYYNWIKESNK